MASTIVRLMRAFWESAPRDTGAFCPSEERAGVVAENPARACRLVAADPAARDDDGGMADALTAVRCAAVRVTTGIARSRTVRGAWRDALPAVADADANALEVLACDRADEPLARDVVRADADADADAGRELTAWVDEADRSFFDDGLRLPFAN